jgi:hypothetical protein
MKKYAILYPMLLMLGFLFFTACNKDNSNLTTQKKCSCKSTKENLSSDYRCFVPTLLTPNNDGYNDRLYIDIDSLTQEGDYLRIYKKNIKVKISTQRGSLVYSSDDYSGNWAPDAQAAVGTAYKLEVSIPDIFNYKGELTFLTGVSEKFYDTQCCRVIDTNDPVYDYIVSR